MWGTLKAVTPLQGTGRNLGGARAVVKATTAVVGTEGAFGQAVTSNRKSTGLFADKAKRAPAHTEIEHPTSSGLTALAGKALFFPGKPPPYSLDI